MPIAYGLVDVSKHTNTQEARGLTSDLITMTTADSEEERCEQCGLCEDEVSVPIIRHFCLRMLGYSFWYAFYIPLILIVIFECIWS